METTKHFMRIHQKPIYLGIVFLLLVLVSWAFVLNDSKQAGTEASYIPAYLMFTPEGSLVEVTKTREAETARIIIPAANYSSELLEQAYLNELIVNQGWVVSKHEREEDVIDIEAYKNGEAVAIRIDPHFDQVYVFVVYRL